MEMDDEKLEERKLKWRRTAPCIETSLEE